MALVHEPTGKILAENVEVADSFWSRFRGLMFRRSFENGEALLFPFSNPRKFGVHTFFVFFPIDLVYLDREMEVLEIKKELSSWSTYKPDVEAYFLVELPGGKVRKVKVEVGDEFEVRGKGINRLNK